MRCREIYSARETRRLDQRLIGALRGRWKKGMSKDHRGWSQTCCGLFVTPLVYLQDQSVHVRCGLTSSKQRSEIGRVLPFLRRGLLIVPDTEANGAQTYWHILKDSHQPPYTDKRDWPKEGRCLNKLLQDIVLEAFFSNFLLFTLRCWNFIGNVHAFFGGFFTKESVQQRLCECCLYSHAVEQQIIHCNLA